MIRPLDPLLDRAAIEGLFARAADYVGLEDGPVPPADSARDLFEGDLPDGVDRARSLHLGLWADGRLDGVASAIFGYPLGRDAYLGLLLLAPEARGRGAGPRLLARIEEAAGLRGATRLLLAVLDTNPRGRAFWDRQGFLHEARFERRTAGGATHGLTRMAKPLGPA